MRPGRKQDEKAVAGGSGVRRLGNDRRCWRADLSVAADHHGGAARPRRLDRRDRAHHGGGHARSARPADHRREHHRRRRHHRSRPASRARRPTATPFGIGQWGTNVANGAIYTLQYDL